MEAFDRYETTEERYKRLVGDLLERQRKLLAERPRQLRGDYRDLEWLDHEAD